MGNDIYLTDREADVMQVLWDHGPSVVNEANVGWGNGTQRTPIRRSPPDPAAMSYVTIAPPSWPSKRAVWLAA